MGFTNKYTTTTLIAADIGTAQLEKTKIVVSSDAYAIGEMIEQLMNT